jgi:glyoxylase-like metal-dependent hydrolase (beta-lactamase superfamily II)
MKPLQSGPITVRRIVETEHVLFEPATLYPDATPDLVERNKGWLDERFLDSATDQLVFGMQSYVVQTGRHNILVDTCNGNLKRRRNAWQHNLRTAYLQNLAAAGLRPTDIDVVLCTHLHSDHVGWNTTLSNGQWLPTFPRAAYLFGAEEFDILNRRHHQAGSAEPVIGGAFADSVLPIIDARLAQFVEMDHVIEQDGDDGVWLEAMPGHTAGQVAVHVKHGAFHVVLASDVLHHPIQLAEPDLRVAFDDDPQEALATRRRLLQTYADTSTIVVPAHFPTPTAGRIITWGDHYRFRLIDR